MKIGALAQQTGTTAPAIRYYESIGLLPRPSRREGGQRSYGENDLRRVNFIRRCRDFGFSVNQVRDLVQLMQNPGRNCMEARGVTHRHLETVRAKLIELRTLQHALTDFLQTCDSLCKGGPGPDCVVLQKLTMTKVQSLPRRRGRAT